MEIRTTKNENACVFRVQETLSEERSLPVCLFHGPEANKLGSHKLHIENKSRIMSFTKAGMTFWSVRVLEHPDLRKMEATLMGQKNHNKRKALLGGMRIPYAMCKTFFLVQKQKFLRNWEIPHV